jgi:hypothetical protein
MRITPRSSKAPSAAKAGAYGSISHASGALAMACSIWLQVTERRVMDRNLAACLKRKAITQS